MNFIEVENRHYILATSTFADQRTMVLKQGDTFGIFDYQGDIHQVGAGKQGIYFQDTRYLSRLELNINGQRPMLLSSSPREDNQMLTVDLTNPDLPGEDEEMILREKVHILRSKFLWQSNYHEKIEFRNFGLEEVDLVAEIIFDADYADIFEVRGSVRERKGKNLAVKKKSDSITFSYLGLDDVVRSTKAAFKPQPNSISQNAAVYDINLKPGEGIDIELKISFQRDEEIASDTGFEQSRQELNANMEKMSRYCADISSSNENFNRWIERSKSDLITMTTQTKSGLYPYAGVPWYSTPFGRDGIITAMECLWVEPALAKGVLQYLANTQAHDFNDFDDAEPGKIFHETRAGEMASLGEVPFKLYYGTIDATPLFVCLAGLYLERTNDLETIRKIWNNILAALNWIDNHGDIDGDGFVEYKTKSSKGLTNQGWKDSQDAVFHEDGQLATDPIALCEVQGYVYDAKTRASVIAAELGYNDISERLKNEAEELKEKFNEAFWSESKQTYVIALDGNKVQCNVVSSNAGHCLFSGIATHERAAIIAKNLTDETMFSGWGIRTIATNESRYNPMSYHNGSIWPHDNAMIAYGFSRYNLMRETNILLSAMFETTEHMEDQRLPELFCGFKREREKTPISYPVACSPQAWSVGALFLMIQSCLGLKIDAVKNTIDLHHPVLPSFLREITITNLRMRDKLIILQIRKNKDRIEATILGAKADVTLNIHQYETNTFH